MGSVSVKVRLRKQKNLFARGKQGGEIFDLDSLPACLGLGPIIPGRLGAFIQTGNGRCQAQPSAAMGAAPARGRDNRHRLPRGEYVGASFHKRRADHSRSGKFPSTYTLGGSSILNLNIRISGWIQFTGKLRWLM
jgi:hypothetical protein